MRKLISITLISLGFISKSQVMWQFNRDSVITWHYDWGDEFDGDKLDESKWSYWYGWARSIYGNKEQQYYTDGKNHQVNNGTLKIVARKEGVDAKMVDWLPETDTLKVNNKFYSLNKTHFNYTSGMIRSSRDFLYGFFEIRFKAPSDKGMWPAFWIYGGNPNEEIDIMELKGERPTQVHVDTHCPNECDVVKRLFKKESWGGWIKVNGNLEKGYNVIAGEWERDYVKYYLNGKCIARSKVSFNIPKALVANMAIPSNNGPFHPGPAKNFTASEPFEIDYIRTWTRTPAQGRPINVEMASVKFSALPGGNAKPGRRSKFLFGKKSEHKNEGPIVSVMRGDKKLILYVTGLDAGKKVSAEVKPVNGASPFYSSTFNDFQHVIDLQSGSTGNYVLYVTCEGKTMQYAFSF